MATGAYTSYPTNFSAVLDWTLKQQCCLVFLSILMLYFRLQNYAFATIREFYPAQCLYERNYILTNLVNALPDSSSVNMVQHATIEEAVFSVDPTEAPVDWRDSNHVIFVSFDSCPFRGYISKSSGGFRAVTNYEL
jgi:hypothetical protein